MTDAVIPLRQILRPRELVGQQHLPVLSVYRDHGVILKGSRTDNFNKTPLDLSRYQEVRPGDLVVNKMKAWQGSLAVSQHHGIVSPDYLVCKVSGSIDPGYLHYLLRSSPLIAEYERRSKGIRPAQWRLYWEDLAAVSVAMPCIEEQRRIAAYLDCEMNRINLLATLRRQQLALWMDRRRALISRGTAGVVEEGDLQPARSRRYPRIPRTWRIVRLKHITTKIGSGKTPSGGAESYVPDGIPLLRSQNVHFSGLHMDDIVRISASTHHEMRATAVRAYDVLLNITGASLGRCTFVPPSLDQANVNQHVCILRVDKTTDARYVALACSSDAVQEQIDSLQVGGNREGINFDQVGNLEIAIPRLLEDQVRVRDHITLRVSEVDRITDLVEAQLALLRERKEAAITAAMAGS